MLSLCANQIGLALTGSVAQVMANSVVTVAAPLRVAKLTKLLSTRPASSSRKPRLRRTVRYSSSR